MGQRSSMAGWAKGGSLFDEAAKQEEMPIDRWIVSPRRGGTNSRTKEMNRKPKKNEEKAGSPHPDLLWPVINPLASAEWISMCVCVSKSHPPNRGKEKQMVISERESHGTGFEPLDNPPCHCC